jgi:hypothetical protein
MPQTPTQIDCGLLVVPAVSFAFRAELEFGLVELDMIAGMLEVDARATNP